MAKNTICLWYDKDAEAAARFYAEAFPGCPPKETAEARFENELARHGVLGVCHRDLLVLEFG